MVSWADQNTDYDCIYDTPPSVSKCPSGEMMWINYGFNVYTPKVYF